jgi:hypothetical protein
MKKLMIVFKIVLSSALLLMCQAGTVGTDVKVELNQFALDSTGTPAIQSVEN